MNNNALKKAFMFGVPAAGAAWLFYGLFTSLFDEDTFLEQMTESSGILFGIVMLIVSVCFFFRKASKTEKATEA